MYFVYWLRFAHKQQKVCIWTEDNNGTTVKYLPQHNYSFVIFHASPIFILPTLVHGSPRTYIHTYTHTHANTWNHPAIHSFLLQQYNSCKVYKSAEYHSLVSISIPSRPYLLRLWCSLLKLWKLLRQVILVKHPIRYLSSAWGSFHSKARFCRHFQGWFLCSSNHEPGSYDGSSFTPDWTAYFRR